MKKMFAAAAIFAVTSVHAQELSFGDLNFIIPASKFSLSALVDYRTERETVLTQKKETEGWYLDTLLTYGVSNRFNLFAGLNYQYDVEVENLTTPSNARFKQDGLANPVLGGIYRLQTQSDGSFNFDLGAISRVSVMDAETGDSSGQNSKDGNAADARTSIEFFGRLGKKWNEANEWQLTAGVIQHLEGDSKVLGTAGDTKMEEKSSTDVYARAAYQYRPVHEFFMTLSVQATQVGEADLNNKTANTKSTYKSHLDWDFRYDAKYLIADSCIVRVGYALGRNPDYKVKSAGGTGDIEKRHEQHMVIGTDWLF